MPTPPTPPPGVQNHSKPKLRFNWEDWLPYVAEMDATDDQKRELIEIYWSIILTFADLGWEIGSDNPPAPEKTCGQVSELRKALTAAVLNSETQRQEEKEEV